MRVAFTSGSSGGSGMAAAAICEENIVPVGFMLDSGPVRPSKRSPPRSIAPGRKLWMFSCLAARFPEQFLPGLYRKFGIKPQDAYEVQRRAERRLISHVLQSCGHGFRDLLDRDLIRYPTFSEAAARMNAPFVEVSSVNADESVRLLRQWQPDVIVSLGDRILRPHILELPALGVLNCHASLLPSYRGTTTEFWQLVYGETETGVTVHWMAPRVDEGAIVTQGSWPIPAGANHWQLRAASQFLRLPYWRQAIRLVLQGERGRPQPSSAQLTFGSPDLEDLYRFYILKGRPEPRSPALRTSA